MLTDELLVCTNEYNQVQLWHKTEKQDYEDLDDIGGLDDIQMDGQNTNTLDIDSFVHK